MHSVQGGQNALTVKSVWVRNCEREKQMWTTDPDTIVQMFGHVRTFNQQPRQYSLSAEHVRTYIQ